MRPFASKHKPIVPHQATWRFSGVEWNKVGKLEVFLPERKSMKCPNCSHPDLHIRARIEDMDGDLGYWEVEENGVIVAIGNIISGDPLWRNGDGPRLEAERVICYGATGEDEARAFAFRAALKSPGIG